MEIYDRIVTDDEFKNIYDDFKKIEIQNGIPQAEEKRYRLVAEENGNLIGVAEGYTNHKWFVLATLWVHEDYRRQGLGTKLLVMFEDKLKAAGIEHIYLWTSGCINPKFYEKQGYKVFTILENLYELEGYHYIGYRKDLI